MGEMVVGSCVPLPAGPVPRGAPVVVLCRADRELLKRCRETVENLLDETPESLADPARRDLLLELLADISESLGAQVVEKQEVGPAKRTIKLMDGREMQVR